MTRTNFKMEHEYITMTRGDTLSFGIEIDDQNGEALDIDDAYFTCKQNYTDDENVFQKSIGDGITRADAGQYIVRIAPEDTESIEAGKYFYDMQVGMNGDVFTIMKGVLEIELDVTIGGTI